MAAKIKDGLFIGDADTSQDPEFLELNKISNLINFAGREIPNVWAAHGMSLHLCLSLSFPLLISLTSVSVLASPRSQAWSTILTIGRTETILNYLIPNMRSFLRLLFLLIKL
jgi:hypothetical protein